MTEIIDREGLITSLYDLGVVQFGEFTLKSGEKSPIYLDLRLLISRPAALRRVANTLQAFAARLKFDRLGGIPMAGLPVAVALSLAMDRPLIYPRPEMKGYLAGRSIVGEYKAGERILLIDDIISGGHSKAQTIVSLEAADLKVRDVLVVADREMGGVEAMAALGITAHAALKLTEILDMLLHLRRIKKKQHQEVTTWMNERKARH
jgi:uridine monophosphate synthetase